MLWLKGVQTVQVLSLIRLSFVRAMVTYCKVLASCSDIMKHDEVNFEYNYTAGDFIWLY